jgi:hypothetical protein
MRRLGFEERWVQLIIMCVTTVEYAVVVNGKPCGRLIPTGRSHLSIFVPIMCIILEFYDS